jgi:hypothetical protein
MVKHYGGLGGLEEPRQINTKDKFEMAVNRALGADMVDDDEACAEVWCALANVDWTHKNGDTASYSFRAAGDLVAAVSGKGNYTRWYCSGPDGQVSDRVRRALAKEGWRYDAYNLARRRGNDMGDTGR